MKIPQAKVSKRIQATLRSIIDSINEEYDIDTAMDFVDELLANVCDFRIYHEDDLSPDDAEGLMREGMKMGIKYAELVAQGKRPKIYRVPWERTDLFFIGSTREISQRLIRGSAANYG